METAVRVGPVAENVLAGIASGLAATVGVHELPPGTGGRRCVRLLGTEAYDAWLIEWSPGSELDLHDHGGSASAYQIVSGLLHERFVNLDRPAPIETLAFRAGDVRLVPPQVAHGVWNPGPLPTLSVHVYSPPLMSMTYYSTDAAEYLRPLKTVPVNAGTLEPSLV